jgi:hypothetical protein
VHGNGLPHRFHEQGGKGVGANGLMAVIGSEDFFFLLEQMADIVQKTGRDKRGRAAMGFGQRRRL